MGALILFFTVRLNRSTPELARGLGDVILLCIKPLFSANFLNSSPLNGGLLSVRITCGMPHMDKMLSSLGMTVRAENEFESRSRPLASHVDHALPRDSSWNGPFQSNVAG